MWVPISGDHMNAVMHCTDQPALDYNKLPFCRRGIAHLVSSHCTLKQAEHLLNDGEISKREFVRYARIWENSTFRSSSKIQDKLFAIGGQQALERRYKRTKKLYSAWRMQILTTMSREILIKLGKKF
jgi:hypothetical protein